MAFDHLSTFLRSTIVRDPFALRGLIEPEDVLRLEEKYPTLFDKPAPNPARNFEEAKELKEVKEKVVNKISSKPKNDNSPRKALPQERKRVPRPSTCVPAVAKLQTKKPAVSQFHQKCVETISEKPKKINKPLPGTGPPPLKKLCNQMKASEMGKRRILTRPAQSFSMEDLRETLKQVMREDTVVRKVQPSPYTEDLVKKFLGRKLKEMYNNSKKPTRNIEQNKSRTELEKLSSTHVAHDKKKDLPYRKSQQIKVHNVPSAPGFIRGIPDLPPAPFLNYQKQKRVGKKVTFPENDPDNDDDTDAGGNIISNMGELEESSISSWRNGTSANNFCTSEPDYGGSGDCVSPLKYKAKEDEETHLGTSFKTNGERGTSQFFLRSRHNTQEEPLSFVKDSRFQSSHSSNFRQLAKQSHAASWEKKARLRKVEQRPSNTYKKSIQRESRISQNLNSTSARRFFMRKQEEIVVNLEGVKLQTERALKKIAEELVYTEILHQLKQLKQEQEIEDRSKKRTSIDDDSGSNSKIKSNTIPISESLSEQSLPVFVPTSPDSEKSNGKLASKTVSSSVIDLKTPDLTPPSDRHKSQHQSKLKGFRAGETVEREVILRTPDLSPSPRKVAIEKLEEIIADRQQGNFETDCSEMSDFVLSESRIIPPPKQKGNSRKSTSEIIQLDTPRLSRSYLIEKPENVKKDKSEKDPSTLGGVSTLHESAEKSERKRQNACENKSVDPEKSANTPSHYSDDFIPEKNPSVADSPKRKSTSSQDSPVSADSQFVAKEDFHFEEELLEKLNISVETVIDLLSEGEFIGNTLKSPGELSENDKAKSASSKVTLSEERTVCTLSASPNPSQYDEDSQRLQVISEASHISSGSQVVGENDLREDISAGECLIP